MVLYKYIIADIFDRALYRGYFLEYHECESFIKSKKIKDYRILVYKGDGIPRIKDSDLVYSTYASEQDDYVKKISNTFYDNKIIIDRFNIETIDRTERYMIKDYFPRVGWFMIENEKPFWFSSLIEFINRNTSFTAETLNNFTLRVQPRKLSDYILKSKTK